MRRISVAVTSLLGLGLLAALFFVFSSANAFAAVCENKNAKDIAEAEVSLQKYGPDHEDSIYCLLTIACKYEQKNDHAQYLAYVDKALGLYSRVKIADEMNLMYIETAFPPHLENEIKLAEKTGRFDDAAKRIDRYIEVTEKKTELEPIILAEAYGLRAKLYMAKNEPDKATAAYEEQLKHLEKAKGPDSKEVLSLLGAIAKAHRDRKEWAKALGAYERVLKIQEKTLGPEHADLAPTLFRIGQAYKEMKQYDKALAAYERQR